MRWNVWSVPAGRSVPNWTGVFKANRCRVGVALGQGGGAFGAIGKYIVPGDGETVGLTAWDTDGGGWPDLSIRGGHVFTAPSNDGSGAFGGGATYWGVGIPVGVLSEHEATVGLTSFGVSTTRNRRGSMCSITGVCDDRAA